MVIALPAHHGHGSPANASGRISSARKCIFISYRRSDSEGFATLFHRQLTERFDPEIVYFDKYTPKPGDDFAAGIEAALAEASVVLVLIGRQWLGELAMHAREGTTDFVRMEVERALQLREKGAATVIPVLTGISEFPKVSDLPAPLPAPLSALVAAIRQSQELKLYVDMLDGSNFAFDGLMALLKSIPGVPEPADRLAPSYDPPFQLGTCEPAPHFSDVDDRMGELETAFITGRRSEGVEMRAIRGMAGVGKTQLALQFAIRHRSSFDGGIWLLPGQTAASLVESAAEACRACLVPLRPEDDTRVVWRAWLEHTRQRWLIIVDDLASPDLLRGLLPRVGRHSVLVTTRDLSLEQATVLEPWSEPVAAAYLGERLKGHKFRPSAAELRELARTLGGVPLAIAHAAAYLNATGQPVTSYVDALNDVDLAPALLESRARNGPVLATLLTALDRCEPAARHLLQTLACFADEPVPERWLRADAAARSRAEQALVAGEVQWNEWIAQLRSLALVERVGIYPAEMVLREKAGGKRVQPCLQLNRLTQQALLAVTPTDADARIVATQLLARAARVELAVPARTIEYVCLATHLVFRGTLDNGREAAGLLRLAVDLHVAKGNLPAAYECSERWMKRAIQLWGEDSWETVDAVIFLAERIADLAGPTESLPWARRALEIATGLAPAVAGSVTRARAIEARCLAALGQSAEALQIYHEHVLDGYLLAHPNPAVSRWLLRALGDMGQLLLSTGSPQGALNVQGTILEMAQSEFGPWDETTLHCADTLAVTFQALHQHDLAHRLWLDVVEGRLTVSGPLHPATISAQCGLAAASIQLGQFDRALALYDQALSSGNLTFQQNDPRLRSLRDGLRLTQEKLTERAV